MFFTIIHFLFVYIKLITIFALINKKQMGYKWKPNATQRAAYAEKCREKETIGVMTTHTAIREGCWVKYYSMSKGGIVEGYVINSSYGSDKGQHTFTIDWDGEKVLVKGRNLYPNIIEHKQGETSIKETI
jgi:hypothetical protein